MSLEQKTIPAENEAKARTPGLLKRAAIAATAIITLGAVTPAKSADFGAMSHQEKQGGTKSESVVTIGPGVYKDGKYVGERNGPGVYDKDGKPIGGVIDFNQKSHVYDTDENITNSYQDIDEQIRQNPNQASLYIQKAEMQIRNEDPPQRIIETLEYSLKQRGLLTKGNELINIYNALGNLYQESNIGQSLVYYKKAYELAPNSSTLKSIIYDLSRKVNR